MPIKLQSSSGGSVTVNIPVTASNYNVTVPAATGTAMVSGNMPAFSVYTNDSSAYFASSTATKVRFNTLIFDTNNNFDAVTNYRFTPTVAGYYQLNSFVSGSCVAKEVAIYIYKNGNNYKNGLDVLIPAGGLNYGIGVNSLVYANGTTDYFEIYLYSDNSQTLGGTSVGTYFNGAMVRSA